MEGKEAGRGEATGTACLPAFLFNSAAKTKQTPRPRGTGQWKGRGGGLELAPARALIRGKRHDDDDGGGGGG